MKGFARSVSLVAILVLGFVGVANAADGILKQIEDAFIAISTDLRPAVVNIDAKSSPAEGFGGDVEQFEEFFRFFNIPVPEQGPMPRQPRRRVSSGSGFIFDKEGHIVTNNHVVEQADALEVKLWNGNVYDATVVGRDPQTDVAVIKIEPKEDLPVVKLGDSDQLKVGQYTIAAGSPRGLEGSFSFGHVTALGRQLNLQGLRFQDFIQTDAAINLGNSGGPLCNIDGEVIGINTAIVFGAESLGFAIPVNMAKKIIPELIAKGRIVRGYLGVHIRAAKEYSEAVGLPDEDGAFVIKVAPDTPADRAGVHEDDIIRKVNGEAVKDDGDLVAKISDIEPGSDVKLEVWRDGRAEELTVNLEAFPDEEAQVAKAPAKEVLGLRVQALSSEMIEGLGLEKGTKGIFVEDVEFDSPADKGGVRQGDVIVKVGKEAVTSPEQFRQIVKDQAKPGKSLLMRVLRGGDMPNVVVIKVPEE